MSLNTSRTAARRALRCQWKTQSSAAPTLSRSSFSTSRSTQSSESSEGNPNALTADLPRWAFTPERMKAPFSHNHIKDPSRSVWRVNDNPKKLDTALNNFLGSGGERLLSEELKWLAVTHKSFDQGRRGFNDRLAYLGRQIAVAEATQEILSAPAMEQGEETAGAREDIFAGRREPYHDPYLRSLNNLSVQHPNDTFEFKKVAQLAIDTGIAPVVRWKPRMPENLEGSGFHPVIVGAVWAIVGAIASQNGGKVASRVVRERILKKLR